MIKYFLTTPLLFLFWESNAQTSLRPGFRAGANFSQITGTYYEPRTDFYFGAFGEIKLSSFFFIQPELGFSRQGAKGDVYLQPRRGSGEVNKEDLWFGKNIESNSITLGATGKMAFSPAVRFLFGFSAEHAIEGLEAIKPLRNELDMALVAGVEYKFPFGMGVEVRIKKGTWDMIDSREYETTGSRRLFEDRNLNVVLQAGLNYSLGGR